MTASIVDSESAAVYIKDKLIQPGPSTNPRTLQSRFATLRDELKRSTEDIRIHIRGGLSICLRELQYPETPWYAENNDEYPRADELLLFANNEGTVVTKENKGEVLDLIEAIPEDIQERIAHQNKEIRRRCMQTIVGLLSDDQPSREFIERTKEKYSLEFWKTLHDDPESLSLMSCMESFHGARELYKFIQGKKRTAFKDSLFSLRIIVECSWRTAEWKDILAQENGTDAKTAKILGAIREGFEARDRNLKLN